MILIKGVQPITRLINRPPSLRCEVAPASRSPLPLPPSNTMVYACVKSLAAATQIRGRNSYVRIHVACRQACTEPYLASALQFPYFSVRSPSSAFAYVCKGTFNLRCRNLVCLKFIENNRVPKGIKPFSAPFGLQEQPWSFLCIVRIEL